jgi:histidyl-tRNA synthetase
LIFQGTNGFKYSLYDFRDIRKRIEKQRQKIFELTDELEQAKEAFEKLQEELKEQQKKELLEAFDKSNRSFEEVLDFMKGKADI